MYNEVFGLRPSSSSLPSPSTMAHSTMPLSGRPAADRSTELARQIGELRQEIDAALEGHTQFGEGCPRRLREAIRYSLLAPGKRLRPILVLLAAEACGLDRGRAMPAACAVEMVHAYSLIHDDLPAMDDDDLRRGRETCHRVFGEDVAILVGDALLARAFELLATEIMPAEVAVNCCRALAQAAGACQLVGGQADDLDPENQPETLEALTQIHLRKTAAMICVCARLGGIVAQAGEHQIAALASYGQKLGLAFQIVDDLLDAQGNEQQMGKRAKKDADRGKLTFPRLLGIEESRQRARQFVREAQAEIAVLGSGASSLIALADYMVERDR